ncbi:MULTISPECIES: sodium:solute symporter family protein [unclassified Thermoactinomyces]|uniref:sodium:solute symporter family protein n=1 Tax=unclassified Thermoactinomyces TaxID=2634588 RepID=UPI0018DEBAD7|nr:MULTISPECIES: sodium:solute symporter family protein [unclassified Thermoactinomyces]MBH8598200.1 sodium:solute symporter family protein [Thermoactinomyces sp. CICC 10523]MBH8603229.1 sodium:solute symporter family protein [Thermoactinomyces sp. CICC 10522]
MGHSLLHAGLIDYVMIAIYFVVVLGIGFLLKNKMKTGDDFFLSGRSIPSWITSLAFLSANLGALEVLGMAANGAEYGLLTTHFYWIGAIPAMLFLGLYMMPFYYASKVRSVPEYLKFRFNEATRAVNAISFAVMTVLVSGISLYSMALIFQVLIGWSFNTSILISAVVVLIYVALGGLTSSIYTEVIQFFLIWLGLFLIPVFGLHELGGWQAMMDRLPEAFGHMWSNLGHSSDNAMGISWLGVVLGLGFVLSFGYWTTDFLVVQRAFAARDMRSAQNTPIYASFFKMVVPFLVIIPGLIAAVLYPKIGHPGGPSYNLALPLLIQRYFPPGLMGLGLTAMLASFMSGMAGNVTAFTTIWTYDIYQAYFKKDAPDRHYVRVGRWTVVIGILISIGTAYIAADFPSVMDYMQTLFSFFNAPLFATFLLGMFWKRATPWGGFWGLISGTVGAFLLYYLIPADYFASAQAGNFWRAWWAWVIAAAVTVLVSFVTKPKDEAELKGLVYGFLQLPSYRGERWYKRPGVMAVVVLVILIGLNIVFL